MSGAAGNAGNDDEVDFDRLENEASKVFALWELMGTAPPAAAAAVESPLEASASAAEDMPAVREVWTTDAGKTAIDGKALPRELEPAMEPAAEIAPAALAPAALAPAALAPAGGFAPDASLPDVTQAHAALPPIAAVAPPFARPAENVVPQVVSQRPTRSVPAKETRNIYVSAELAQPVAPVVETPRSEKNTVNLRGKAVPPPPEPAAPRHAEEFTDRTIRIDALDLPQRKVSPMFWVGSAAALLLIATGGLIWLSSGPEDVPTPPPSSVVAEEASRPVPLPSALPPSAPTVAPTAPVVAAEATPAAPVAVPATPVAVTPTVPAAPVAVAGTVPAEPVAAAPVAPAARIATSIRTPPAEEEETPRTASSIRRRLPTTTSMREATSMRETSTSMRPSSLMGDNPY